VYLLKRAHCRKVEVLLSLLTSFSQNEFNFYSLVHFAVEKVDTLMKSGVDLVEAINSSSVFLVQAAKVCIIAYAVFEKSI